MNLRSGFAGGAFIALALATTGAQAATVYTENFNDPGFRDTQISPDPYSDKDFNATYWNIKPTYDNWTFATGSTFVALDGSATNGAILLNENSPPPALASTTVGGLTANTLYTLTFDLWGDNRPGQDWVLKVSIDNTYFLTVVGTDLARGTNPGTVETISFTSNGTSAFLSFTQDRTALQPGSQGSPIFDNVTISDANANAPVVTPLPAALPLFASGLGAMGFIGWRRKRKAAKV